MSRAPSPAGVAPRRTRSRHRCGACSGEHNSSTPSSPVYPVPQTRTCSPEIRSVSVVIRAGSGESATAWTISRASGPWTAIIAHSSRRSLTCASGKSAATDSKPGEVGEVVGGVRNREVAVHLQAVGEQVVQHAAVLAAEHAVLRAAGCDRRDVVGEQPLQELERLRTAGLDLPHVRNVEDPRSFPDRHVLLAHPGVLNGHLPAREPDELGTGRDVLLEQGRAAQSGRCRGHGAQASASDCRPRRGDSIRPQGVDAQAFVASGGDGESAVPRGHDRRPPSRGAETASRAARRSRWRGPPHCVRPWLRTAGHLRDRGDDPTFFATLVDDCQIELLRHDGRDTPDSDAGLAGVTAPSEAHLRRRSLTATAAAGDDPPR